MSRHLALLFAACVPAVAGAVESGIPPGDVIHYIEAINTRAEIVGPALGDPNMLSKALERLNLLPAESLADREAAQAFNGALRNSDALPRLAEALGRYPNSTAGHTAAGLQQMARVLDSDPATRESLEKLTAHLGQAEPVEDLQRKLDHWFTNSADKAAQMDLGSSHDAVIEDGPASGVDKIKMSLSPAQASKPKEALSGYNEAVGESGALRPAYRAFEDRTGVDPLNPPLSAVRELASGHPLGDNIKILPVPLILPRREYASVQAGTAQRLRGLMAFFGDVVFGKKRIFKDAALRQRHGIPAEFREKLVNSIFADEGLSLASLRKLWKGRSVDDINVVYGPDIVRNPEGNWVVLEDNISEGSHVGGMGDLDAIQRAFRKTFPANKTAPADTAFFESMIKRFLVKQGLGPKDPGVVALMRGYEDEKKKSPADQLDKDMEDLRKISVLERLGIKILDPDKLSKDENEKLLAGKYRAVLNLDNPGGWVEKQRFFKEVFEANRSVLLSSPGLSTVSNKAFLPYVDHFIRFYLNEEPLLRTQPTKVMTQADLEDLSSHVNAASNARWVAKRGSGLQGSEVYIFGRMNSAKQNEFLDGVKTWRAWSDLTGKSGAIFVLQEHVEASVIPAAKTASWVNFYVDLRPLTIAQGPRDVFVSPVPWARSVGTAGTGLNNVSQGSYELVVILEDPDQPADRQVK